MAVFGRVPAPFVGRRRFVLGAAAAIFTGRASAAEPARRFRVGFANLTEEPGSRLEGLGFSGFDVRHSFELAARTLPIEITYLDNNADAATAVGNADLAIDRKLDLLIEYCADPDANAEIGRKLKAAGIPALAINYAIPGAPLYTADHYQAGRIGGQALAAVATREWKDEPTIAIVAGDLGDVGTAVSERVRGIAEAVHGGLPNVRQASLDTSGNPIRIEGLLKKFLATVANEKLLIATLDDATALAARGALELLQRTGDCAVCGQGMDRTLHGGAGDKKEIDPGNRNSVVIGSVAYFLDRYGYEVLPLAMKMLRGEAIPPRTTTRHILVTAENVFSVYPPYDMN